MIFRMIMTLSPIYDVNILANSSALQDQCPSEDPDLGYTDSNHPNTPSIDVWLAWPNPHNCYPVPCQMTPCLVGKHRDFKIQNKS